MRRSIREREHELAQLAQATRDAASGTGSIVLVHGESGIGKSSLVQAVRGLLPAEGRFLIGYCDDLTTPRRLRATLGAGVIMGGRPGYRLHDQISVDLHEGGASVAEAEARLAVSDAPTAWLSARRALGLLDGGWVLADLPEADWVEQARASHQALLRRARLSFAEAALHIGHGQRARAAAEAALGADRYDEAACRLLMRAYQATDEPARALLAYERLRSTLAVELGTDPAPTTQRLHVAILQRQP